MSKKISLSQSKLGYDVEFRPQDDPERMPFESLRSIVISSTQPNGEYAHVGPDKRLWSERNGALNAVMDVLLGGDNYDVPGVHQYRMEVGRESGAWGAVHFSALKSVTPMNALLTVNGTTFKVTPPAVWNEELKRTVPTWQPGWMSANLFVGGRLGLSNWELDEWNGKDPGEIKHSYIDFVLRGGTLNIAVTTHLKKDGVRSTKLQDTAVWLQRILTEPYDLDALREMYVEKRRVAAINGKLDRKMDALGESTPETRQETAQILEKKEKGEPLPQASTSITAILDGVSVPVFSLPQGLYRVVSQSGRELDPALLIDGVRGYERAKRFHGHIFERKL